MRAPCGAGSRSARGPTLRSAGLPAGPIRSHLGQSVDDLQQVAVRIAEERETYATGRVDRLDREGHVAGLQPSGHGVDVVDGERDMLEAEVLVPIRRVAAPALLGEGEQLDPSGARLQVDELEGALVQEQLP